MSGPPDRDIAKVPAETNGTLEDVPTDHEPTPLTSGPRGIAEGHVDTQPEHQVRLKARAGVGVGTIVGERYRLVERLGGGAMGDVYVAENVAIRLRVAVKLLKS